MGIDFFSLILLPATNKDDQQLYVIVCMCMGTMIIIINIEQEKKRIE